jgi:hypothetical protein
MNKTIKQTSILALLLAAGISFAEERHDYSGNIDTGIFLEYDDAESRYVTYYGGTLGQGTYAALEINAWEFAGELNVDVGYMPDGQIVSETYLTTDWNGIHIAGSAKTDVRNAAQVYSVSGEGLHFDAINNNAVLNTVYNAAQGRITAGMTGVYLNNSGNASSTIQFTNDGYVANVGDTGYTGLLIDNGGVAGSYKVINNGTIESTTTVINSYGNYGIATAGSDAKSVEIINRGTIQSASSTGIYFETNIDDVKITNSGLIQGGIAQSSDDNTAIVKTYELRNEAGGVISGNVFIQKVSDSTYVQNDGRMTNGTLTLYGTKDFHIVNNGSIENYENGSSYGACLETNNYSGGMGLIQNFGTIGAIEQRFKGDEAVIYIGGSNTRFEHRGVINGVVTMYIDDYGLPGGYTVRNTFAIYAGASSLSGNQFFNQGTLEFVVEDASNYGQLLIVDESEFDGGVYLSEMDLFVDASLADMDLGDTLTVVSIYEGGTISGTFDNIANTGDRIWFGDYEFEIAYGTNDIILTVTNVIPEPSTYAAIFGALALAFVAYRRRG